VPFRSFSKMRARRSSAFNAMPWDTFQEPNTRPHHGSPHRLRQTADVGYGAGQRSAITAKVRGGADHQPARLIQGAAVRLTDRSPNRDRVRAAKSRLFRERWPPGRGVPRGQLEGLRRGSWSPSTSPARLPAPSRK